MQFCICLVFLFIQVLDVAVHGDTSRSKRGVKVDHLFRYVFNILNDLKKLERSLQKVGTTGGGTYTRWGKSTCPKGSELVYAGEAGGSHHDHTGAAVNYLCLPFEPIYDEYDASNNIPAYVYGASYYIYRGYKVKKGTLFNSKEYNSQAVPCASCIATNRAAVTMIPGRNACFPGMHKEYSGYLMAGHFRHNAASEYVCVDKDAETRAQNKAGHHKMFFFVESICGVLNCQKYKSHWELTCVVCSK